jgi:flagellum-specific peptidoglycan hydrolase FlgJ
MSEIQSKDPAKPVQYEWDLTIDAHERENDPENNDGNFWYAVCILILLFFGYKSCTTKPYLEEDREIEAARNRDNTKVIVPAASVPVRKRSAALQVQAEYMEHWLPIAKAEYEKFGIPISIQMAQAIVESSSGRSKVCQRTKNHFGVMDDHKYRYYNTNWESWRDHSLILTKPRYRDLHGKDYKGWAIGLQEKGYAEDEGYADTLIKVIEYWKLDRYDNL